MRLPAGYHTGHRTSPEPKRRRFGAPHPAALGAPLAYPPAASLLPFAPPVFDQGATETCFGHATSTAITITLAAAGFALPWVPSPFRIVQITLCEEQPTGLLQDTGADMTDVMTAIAREGISAMGPVAPDGRYSDVVPIAPGPPGQTGWARPTLLEDEAAAQDLVLGADELSPTASDYIDLLCDAIGNRRIGVTTGIHATPDFQAYTAGAPALTDPRGATETDGHDVVPVAYRTNPTTGRIEIGLLSSWGPRFGTNGMAWVDAHAWLVPMTIETWRLGVRLGKAAT